MIQLLSVLAALLLTMLLIGGVYLMKRRAIAMNKARKIAAVVLSLVAFYRYMIEREAIFVVRGLDMFSPFGDNIPQTLFGIILVWFSVAAIFTVVMDVCYDMRTLRNITRYFSVPVLLLDLVFFGTYAKAIIGPDAFEVFDIRLVLLLVEIALAITLVVSRIIEDGITPPTKTDMKRFAYTLPFVWLVHIPTYAPQAILGYASESVKIYDLSEAHRIVLYFAIIIPFILFHVYKNRSEEVKRFGMIYISMALLVTYLSNWTFASLANPLSWPLHLCNTAMFIIPICLIFRLENVFNFCLFINVLGAVLAMLIPNTPDSVNALAWNRVLFWINHYPAFFMPILAVALKLFKRPKFKEWVYSLIVFTIYFISMLILNAWFSNYGKVDFFFLNSDFIVEKLGKWAENTRNYVVSFNIKNLTFTFYPLYQTLFYLVYVAITVAIWFLYEILFSSWDAAEDRRLRERDYKIMKAELHKFLGGRSIHEPVGGDSSPHLVLNSFSKRYGRNKHYSVDNVSFEVKGGEIFGFLGPNGAGKSTIIKSVVGIQTITSGSIEICGFDVDKQSVQAKKELGFVPDHYALYENLTGREYINYIADLYEVGYDYRNETIEKYVKLFQLTGSFDNQMKTYSHGMKQKITIMAALVHNPKVWILDEPLTGLDPTSIHEVKECMKEHAAKGNIVFFSSHIIDVVEKICDKIAIIKKGKLRAVAKVSELEARGIELEQFYLDIIYGDDSDTSVKLIGVTAEEAGIYPDDNAKPEPAGEVVAAQ